MAMISIADSRFQADLLAKAKAAGKLPKAASVPAPHRNNTPQNLRNWLAPVVADGTLVQFPFGTDFTDVEQQLLGALSILKAKAGSTRAMAALLWRGLVSSKSPMQQACLQRLSLQQPRSVTEWLTAQTVKGALAIATEH